MSQVCGFREGPSGGREERPRRVVQVATYASGRPYSTARGRYAERTAVEDYLDCEKAVVSFLEGIVVWEPRPGWVTLEVPPLERWETPLCALTAAQRARIESPEFYHLLQQHIGRRYLAWKKSRAQTGTG